MQLYSFGFSKDTGSGRIHFKTIAGAAWFIQLAGNRAPGPFT